jgi:protein gp37
VRGAVAIGTGIEWTDATWNPVAGCTAISPGCTNCYAARMAGRLVLMGAEKYRGTVRRSGRRSVWTGRLSVDESAIEAPLGWRRPRRIFVNSMSDLFHEEVPFGALLRIWSVMAEARWHTFQVLTKRPERMRAYLAGRELAPLSNVWLGTSVENAAYLPRLDDLRATPTPTVRFVSFEPLLGSVATADLSGIDWAIVGGESGPGARPMRRLWVEEIRAGCARSGTAFFFKQWGGARKGRAGRELDGRTFDDIPAEVHASI